MSDPVALLVHDHRRMEALLTKVADAEGQLRGPILDDVADALSAHLALEEEQLYPAVRAQRTEDILRESLEEHLSLKLRRGEALDPRRAVDERAGAAAGGAPACAHLRTHAQRASLISWGR